MRTALIATYNYCYERFVGMKPLSERDENFFPSSSTSLSSIPCRNEATLWKRWELTGAFPVAILKPENVGMKPLSERDENKYQNAELFLKISVSRNEATLWKRWELCLSRNPVCNVSNVCRNEATLWKRWERIQRLLHSQLLQGNVGMKPLSERDENIYTIFISVPSIDTRRNEATLWKRWEPIFNISNLFSILFSYEWSHSLKEMRTCHCASIQLLHLCLCRNEATLWKRWEPTSAVLTAALLATCRNEATLWKRWEHTWIATHEIAYVLCRNEATLWKRWEPMWILNKDWVKFWMVGMKPLSERDENRRAGLN